MARYLMSNLFSMLGISGPDLLLREYGQRARTVLEEQLQEVGVGDALIMDFSGVSVMDTSFADESILELALALVVGQYGDRFLVLERLSPATVDNLEGTIARRRAKVALLAYDGSRMTILGHLERNLVEAWELTRRGGTLTARDLANEIGLEINTASTRLHKLYAGRLLARREEITALGRQHIYLVPQ